MCVRFAYRSKGNYVDTATGYRDSGVWEKLPAKYPPSSLHSIRPVAAVYFHGGFGWWTSGGILVLSAIYIKRKLRGVSPASQRHETRR